jgi:hypothetical protein
MWVCFQTTANTELSVQVFITDVNMSAAGVFFTGNDTLITRPWISTVPSLTLNDTVQMNTTTRIYINAPFTATCTCVHIYARWMCTVPESVHVTYRAMYVAGPTATSEVTIGETDTVTDGQANVFYLDYAFAQVGAWNLSVWITNGVDEVRSAPYMVGGEIDIHLA